MLYAIAWASHFLSILWIHSIQIINNVLFMRDISLSGFHSSELSWMLLIPHHLYYYRVFWLLDLLICYRIQIQYVCSLCSVGFLSIRPVYALCLKSLYWIIDKCFAVNFLHFVTTAHRIEFAAYQWIRIFSAPAMSKSC